MVKADAYGHGLPAVARALDAADGFGVARLQEALTLRNAGVTKRVVLLGTLLDVADLAVCSKWQIDVTAHDEVSVSLIMANAETLPVRVWLKLDSGMHRLGLHPGAFVAADRQLSIRPGILELIHMTHFSSANRDSAVMERQLSRFWDCHKVNSAAPVSLANSAALVATCKTHGDWVRPGILLYGENPPGACPPVGVRAAMTLRSRVIAIRQIGNNEPVGYNECWRSHRASQIATVGIGYADGYPRHARNGTPVWINGHFASLVGRVSMDSLTVDVTECGPVTVGDEAIMWGPELPAATVAECAHTISYELFTSVQQRVSREYSSAEKCSEELAVAY